MADEPPPLEPGEVLDARYRILRVVASGAMGVVYVAQHLTLGRLVALKVLRASLASDRELVARFEQEARAASAIGHPNIIAVFDLGRCSQGPFMVMELLDGLTLADLLAVEGKLPWLQAAGIADQILAALAAAHGAGIVHRDLKPDNIFLVELGEGKRQVKVLDFGISKVLGNPQLAPLSVGTRYGAVMGTAEYMSPEQARGQTSLIDHRTDIFAAGVVLYEMLCGEPPFTGDSYNAVLAAILERRIVPIARQRKDVPPALVDVVMKALAHEREQRWQQAVDMRQALLAVKEDDGGELDIVTDEPAGMPDSFNLIDLDDRADAPTPAPVPLRVTAPIKAAPSASAPARAISAPARAVAPASEATPDSAFAAPHEERPLLADVVDIAQDVQPRRPRQMASRTMAAPLPRPALRGWFLVVAALALCAGLAGISWYVHQGAPLPGATSSRVALRVRPEQAEVRLDDKITDERLVELPSGSEHRLTASARGYIPAELRFRAGRTSVAELRLTHALPPLEGLLPPALPAELAATSAPAPASWEGLDRGMQHLTLHFECLARGRRSDCDTLRRLALPLAQGRGPVDGAAEAYLKALGDSEAGRGVDPSRAAAALAAVLWAERARLDAQELALLGESGRDADWQLRCLLLAARQVLRGGGAGPRATAGEALDALRREAPDEPLEAAAADLVAVLEHPKKAVPAYNQLVERFNSRPRRP